MAGNSPVQQKRGFIDDLEDYVAQKKADLDSFLQDSGRKAWGQTIGNGPSVASPSTGDIATPTAQGSGATLSRPYISLIDGTDQTPGSGMRAIGGFVAGRAGNLAGVVRAGVHSAESAGDAINFAGRTLFPIDQILKPPGNSPANELASAANAATNYVANAIAHPVGLLGDVTAQMKKWNQDLNPLATPQADTLSGELNRNFKIGENQGELATEAAALAFGGAATKVLPRLGPISEAAGTAKFLDQGFSPAQAARLAKPYDGMGGHFLARRTRFPATFLGMPLPKSIAGQLLPKPIIDGKFNVLKPNNIHTGDFYQLHFETDPQAFGFKIFPKGKGTGWSGRKLGLERHGLLGRIWFGSPAPLNALVGTTGAAGLIKHESDEDDGAW